MYIVSVYVLLHILSVYVYTECICTFTYTECMYTDYILYREKYQTLWSSKPNWVASKWQMISKGTLSPEPT